MVMSAIEQEVDMTIVPCNRLLSAYFVEKLLRVLGSFAEVDRTKRGLILHDGTAE